jgi:hypothetical protein
MVRLPVAGQQLADPYIRGPASDRYSAWWWAPIRRPIVPMYAHPVLVCGWRSARQLFGDAQRHVTVSGGDEGGRVGERGDQRKLSPARRQRIRELRVEVGP